MVVRCCKIFVVGKITRGSRGILLTACHPDVTNYLQQMEMTLEMRKKAGSSAGRQLISSVAHGVLRNSGAC